MFSWMDPYAQFVTGTILLEALLVLSLFAVYQAGVLSLAIVGFMANGAYMASILSTHYGWGTYAAILTATALTGVLGALFGLLVLHLRGIYLAMATFAVGQICVLIYANMSLAGGPGGIVGIPLDIGTTQILLAVVVVCVVLQLVHRSRTGRALRVMHVDDRIASGIGVNVGRYRAFAFAGSGVIAGLAGSLEAFRTGVIAPEQYNFALLVQVLALAMIGGSFHWSGALIAAVGIGVLQELIGTAGNHVIEGFLYGGLLLVVMLVLPDGIVDRRLVRQLKKLPGRKKRPSRQHPAAMVEVER